MIFVSPRIEFFFNLRLPCSFLESNAENWLLNDEYLKARETITNIKVTNDIAERRVKLIEEYKILTNYEEQKQYIL